ncbi:MAG TPA: DUF2690 domain-containing protein [Herpetosiphonaceae bacterium]
MNSIARFARLFALASALVPVATFAAPAAQPAQLLSACQLSPSRTNCDYQDPQATGCNNDAYNLAQADSLGVVRAVVRYSPSCKSAWARAVNLSNQPNTRITAQIARNTGGLTARTEIYPTTAAVSNMLYIGDGSLAQATATLQNSYGQILGQSRTGWVR